VLTLPSGPLGPGTGSRLAPASRSLKVTLASGLRCTHSSRTPSGHGLSGPRRRLNSSTKMARTRRCSAGSVMTVVVAGKSATTPCLMWKVNRGWAARLARRYPAAPDSLLAFLDTHSHPPRYAVQAALPRQAPKRGRRFVAWQCFEALPCYGESRE
jgi:hypothetical protein